MMAQTIVNMNDEKSPQAIAAMLARIHITVELKNPTQGQYFKSLIDAAADMMISGMAI